MMHTPITVGALGLAYRQDRGSDLANVLLRARHPDQVRVPPLESGDKGFIPFDWQASHCRGRHFEQRIRRGCTRRSRSPVAWRYVTLGALLKAVGDHGSCLGQPWWDINNSPRHFYRRVRR